MPRHASTISFLVNIILLRSETNWMKFGCEHTISKYYYMERFITLSQEKYFQPQLYIPKIAFKLDVMNKDNGRYE